MIRNEFVQSMDMLCKALGVKVNSTQADMFFAEFRGFHAKDFAHACRELSLGNPGYLPKIAFFRDNVLAAQEMRQDGERRRKNALEQEEIQRGASPTNDDGKYTMWREGDPELFGKSEWEKGQIISHALKRKLDMGLAVYTLRDKDSFAFWNEDIPVEQKGRYGEKQPFGVGGFRWVKTKWKKSPTA